MLETSSSTNNPSPAVSIAEKTGRIAQEMSADVLESELLRHHRRLSKSKVAHRLQSKKKSVRSQQSRRRALSSPTSFAAKSKSRSRSKDNLVTTTTTVKTTTRTTTTTVASHTLSNNGTHLEKHVLTGSNFVSQNRPGAAEGGFRARALRRFEQRKSMLSIVQESSNSSSISAGQINAGAESLVQFSEPTKPEKKEMPTSGESPPLSESPSTSLRTSSSSSSSSSSSANRNGSMIEERESNPPEEEEGSPKALSPEPKPTLTSDRECKVEDDSEFVDLYSSNEVSPSKFTYARPADVPHTRSQKEDYNAFMLKLKRLQTLQTDSCRWEKQQEKRSGGRSSKSGNGLVVSATNPVGTNSAAMLFKEKNW